MKRIIVLFSIILTFSIILFACDKIETTDTTSNITTTAIPTTTTTQTTTSATQTTTVITTTSVLSYQVAFDSNGGNVIESVSAERGYPILLPVPHKEGFTFLGWYTSKDPYVYEFTLMNIVVANMTLYAKWSINQYNISFDTQGGIVLNAQIYNYHTDIDLPTPLKTGHTFQGWYEDEECLKSFDYEIMPAHDLRIYAKWTLNQYQVMLHYTYPVDAEETFRIMAKGYGHTIAITQSNKIYAWGLNVSGQLGNGNIVNQFFPIEITDKVPLYPSENVVKIECGGNFTLLLTDQSRLFAFGNNSSFQLAIDTGNAYSTPVDITKLLGLEVSETIKDISSGNNFTILLTSEGRILTWGSNFSGQLGDIGDYLDYKIHDITKNFDLDPLDKIVMIKAGDSHGVAYSEAKKLFTWGINFGGQLGDGTTVNKSLPVDITLNVSLGIDETIAMIVARYNYTLVLTSKGKIFAWGNNSNGNFGNGNYTNSLIPILVTPNFDLGVGEKIVYITAGEFHTLALSSDYRIFIWGSNIYGEFGTTSPSKSNVPIEMTELLMTELEYPIIDIAAGGYSTMVITSNGTVATWGNALYGQLGDDEEGMIHRPKLNITKIVTINYNETIPYGIPVLDGFEFSGWYSDEEKTVLVNPILMPAENLELYGHYTEND